MSKRFTLNEAQALLPRVGELLRRAIHLKSEFDEAEQAIRVSTERIMMMGGVSVNHDSALASKSRRDAAAQGLRDGLEQLEETGCVVKDLDVGLVDFLTLYRGEEVCLCWKLGEPAIEYWHGQNEGFAGRKPIDREFLDHHSSEES